MQRTKGMLIAHGEANKYSGLSHATLRQTQRGTRAKNHAQHLPGAMRNIKQEINLFVCQ